MRNITNIEATSTKAKTHNIETVTGGFRVTSGASGQSYIVSIEPVASCTCKWAQYQPKGRPVACSHVQAVVKHVAAHQGYTATVRSEQDETSHLHRHEVRVGNGVKFTLRRA